MITHKALIIFTGILKVMTLDVYFFWKCTEPFWNTVPIRCYRMLTECLVKYLQNKCGCLNRARGNQIAYTLNSCRNNVGPTQYLKENGWHYVGIYERVVGLKTLYQRRTNRWQLCRPDEQNDVVSTSFVKDGPTILPTKCQLTAIWDVAYK